VAPVKRYLEEEKRKLNVTNKNISDGDPFSNGERLTENSLEEDVTEQVGHYEAEVKANFIKKQIVQIRKALTRLKLGKFGICEECGKMIDTDRLAIKPETTLCIDCERKNN